MPNKVIFTIQGNEFPERHFLSQKIQNRKSQPHQLKLKDLNMTEQELQLWFCELAINGVELKNLKLQFPKKNPFANVDIPDDNEGRAFKLKFENAKKEFLKYRVLFNDENLLKAYNLMFIDAILGNKIKELKAYEYRLYTDDGKAMVRYYNELKSLGLWNIPIVQNNLKKIFEVCAEGMPLFLANLHSIGALTPECLDKTQSFITTIWHEKKINPILNDSSLWGMLKNMPSNDAQRLLQKIMDSPRPIVVLEMFLKLLKKYKITAADCEKCIDGILKINRMENYFHLLDNNLIQDVKFWEFPDPESYLRLIERVDSWNTPRGIRTDNKVLPEWINQHDPALFPLYYQLSDFNREKVFNKDFLSIPIPNNFQLHMNKMQYPIDVILYLDFIRVIDSDKYAQLCDNLDSVSEKMGSDKLYRELRNYKFDDNTLMTLKKYPEILSLLCQDGNSFKYRRLLPLKSEFLNNLEKYYPLLKENKDILALAFPLIANKDFEQQFEQIKILKSQGLLIPQLTDFLERNIDNYQEINALFGSQILMHFRDLSTESRVKILSPEASLNAFELLKHLASNQKITNIENCVRHLFDKENIKNIRLFLYYNDDDASFLNQPNITPYLSFLKAIDGALLYGKVDKMDLCKFIAKQPVEKIALYENYVKTVGIYEAKEMLIDNQMMQTPFGQYILDHPKTKIDVKNMNKYMKFLSIVKPEKSTQNIESLIKDMLSDSRYKTISYFPGIFEYPEILKLCYESAQPEVLWDFYSVNKNTALGDFALKRPDCIPLLNEIYKKYILMDKPKLLSLVLLLEKHHLLTTNFLSALKQKNNYIENEHILQSTAWQRIAALPPEEAQQIMSRIEKSKSILTVLDIIKNAPADRNLVELMRNLSDEAMEKWQMIRVNYPKLLLEMNVLQHPQPEIAFSLLSLTIDWIRKNRYVKTTFDIHRLESKSFTELQGLHQIVIKSDFKELYENFNFYDSPIGKIIVMRINEIQNPTLTRQYIQYIQNLEPERLKAVIANLRNVEKNAKEDERYVKYQTLIAYFNENPFLLSQFNIKSLLSYPNPLEIVELLNFLSAKTLTPIPKLYAMMEQNSEMSQWGDIMKSNTMRRVINNNNIEKVLTSISPHTIKFLDQLYQHIIVNSDFNLRVVENLLKLKNHARLMEKMEENKDLYVIFHLAMGKKEVDINTWQAFIDANMPLDFLKNCPPNLIQSIGPHVGWYADVCQSSNPHLMLEFASYIPSYKNRKEMIDKLEHHPNLPQLYQFFAIFKGQPLILEKHLMDILNDTNLNQMQDLMEKLMEKQLPLSFAYESARSLIRANGSVSIDDYYSLYKQLNYPSEKINGAVVAGMVHLLQLDVAEKLVPLLCQFQGRELMSHLENVTQLEHDANLLRIFPNISFIEFTQLSRLPNIEQLINLPNRESFYQVLREVSPDYYLILKRILSEDNISERAALIHQIRSMSSGCPELLRFVLFMKNPKDFHATFMALPHEQQQVFINALENGRFFRLANSDAIMYYIISSPNLLQNIGFLNQFFAAMGTSIDVPNFRVFKDFMAKFNHEDVDQLSRDLALFSGNTSVFQGLVMELILKGCQIDGPLLRTIGQHPQSPYLVFIMEWLHRFNLLEGDKFKKNMAFLLAHHDLSDLYFKVQNMIHNNQITPYNLEKLFDRTKLAEKTNNPYIAIDEKFNHVHIYVPLTNGQHICTDNTCKSAAALRASFGYDPREPSIESCLQKYINDLKKDISLLRPNSNLCKQKQERLQQMEKYKSSLTEVKKLPDIQALSTSYPKYPAGMNAIMCRSGINLSSMQLSPIVMDGYLRMDNPTFSLRMIDKSDVEPLLRDVLSHMGDSRETLIQAVLSNIEEPKVSLTDLENLLSRKAENLLGIPMKYELDQFTPALRETLNQMNLPPYDIRESFIQSVLRRARAEPNLSYERLQDILTEQTEHILGAQVNYRGVTLQSICDVVGLDIPDLNNDSRDVIEGLLGIAAPGLFDMAPSSPFQKKFTRDKEGDRLSITVQFYLAEINIYCYQQGICHQNFGLLLQNPELIAEFLECLRGCTIETIEQKLFDFVSEHHAQFGLSKALDMKDLKAIQKDFYLHFKTVIDSPHFDEFSILNFDKQAGFYSHGSKISVDYLDFLKEAIPEHPLNKDPQMQAILEESKHLPVDTFKPTDEIKYLSLERMKKLVEDGYPLGFLLAELNESKQLEVLRDFGKFALSILDGSPQEMQNLQGNIAPKALAYLQDLSIAYDKSHMFQLNPEKTACRNALESLSQQFPEESDWLRALLIQDQSIVARGLEKFPNMPSTFIDAVLAQPTLLARINHILVERDAPPLKTPEDLVVYRHVNPTAAFKAKLQRGFESDDQIDQPVYKGP